MINFIFDFDSTLVKTESLNDIINLSLNNDKEKMEEIDNITKMGMEGIITFKESLERRLNLSIITKNMIENITNKITKDITDGMLEFIFKLKQYKNVNIFIVSGGFTEMIIPTANILGIPDKNIFANKFILSNEKVIGVEDSLLLQQSGKAHLIKWAKENKIMTGTTIMIGDGYTDLETFLEGAVDYHIYFAGVINRDNVKNKSNLIANNIQELEKLCIDFIK